MSLCTFNYAKLPLVQHLNVVRVYLFTYPIKVTSDKIVSVSLVTIPRSSSITKQKLIHGSR